MDPAFAQQHLHKSVSSALTPGLILAGLCFPSGVAGLRYAPEQYAWLFAVLVAVGLFVPAVQIIWFTLFDRDRLHSEKFLEKRMMFQHMTPVLGDVNQTIELQSDGQLLPNPRGGKNV